MDVELRGGGSLKPEACNGRRREQLRFAACVLADSLGRQVIAPSAEATVDELRQVMLLESLAMEDHELLDVFASVSLQREIATQRIDHVGRFDESAISWDVSRPWVDIQAMRLGERDLRGKRKDTERASPFSILIAHDVDRTTAMEPMSVFNSLRHTLRLRQGNWWPLAVALSPRAFVRNIERLVEWERSHGIGAQYFMLSGPYGGGRYSSRTDIRWGSAKMVARLVLDAKMSIGLHGSFSARGRNSYGEEKDRLEQTVGCAIITHRNHYLRFDPTRLYAQLEEAGIQCDLSVGFVSRTGFRAGTASRHRAFDLQNNRPSTVVSVPQLFMDTVLQYRSCDSILKELHEALLYVKTVCGCVCLVFHPETFLIDCRAWPLFQEIIQMCQDLGADLSGGLVRMPFTRESEDATHPPQESSRGLFR